MHDGYRVNLTQLEDYTQSLKDTQALYNRIEGLLEEGDLSTKDPSFNNLLGHPQYAGPQQDFTGACRTFLTTYRDLYSQIRALNHHITGKLTYMIQAFTDTHELYRQLDNNNAVVFDGLHKHQPEGDPDGTTGTP